MRMRSGSTRCFTALLALSVVLGACSNDTPEPTKAGSASATATDASPSPDATPTPSATVEVTPSEAPEEPAGDINYEVWFVVGDKIFLEHRTAPATQGVARLAMESLLAGPIGPEAESGDTTAIPEGTSLLGISIADGTATVDLSDEFDSGGGSAGMFLRLAQVVFTLTQFPTVQGVDFRIEGEPVETFSGEGIVLDGPQTRADYEDQVPAIVVEEPAIGEEVQGPLVVKGTANVFEATVSFKVIGENGETLLKDFATATCGTGCRGDFEKELDVRVDRRTTVIVKVFESSAEDGRPTNVVNVPVILLP